MKRILILLSALLFFCSFSYASLTISPEKIEIVAKRDSSFKGEYYVTSNYDTRVDVDISCQNWKLYSGNGELKVEDWLNIPLKRISLAKGETKKVPYEVNIDNFIKGSVSAYVSFNVKPPQSAGINVKMSFPLYVTVHDTQQVEFSAEKIALQNSFDSRRMTAVITVKNDGNTHIRPSGTLNIYGKKKKIVYTTEIPELLPVYAGTSRSEMTVSIPNDLKKGKYTAEVIVRALGMEARKKTTFRVRKDGSFIS